MDSKGMRIITFLKDMPDGGQLVHLVEIEGITAKGKLKCFISHIAEPKGSALHTNLGYEQGTIKDLGELSRRYKARGFHTQRSRKDKEREIAKW